MSAVRRRGGMPLFARTFLLLLAALVVAYAIGMTVLLYRPPPSGPSLAEVAAELSSPLPSGSHHLAVRDSDTEPKPPPARYSEWPPMRRVLAHWLNADIEDVRFYRAQAPGLFGPGMAAPALPRQSPPLFGGGGATLPGGAAPDIAADDPAMWPPPEASPGSLPTQDVMLERNWRPESALRGDFIAALRHADRHWRVVESDQVWWGLLRRLALLLLAGTLALLPLAWWFSRALASPIRRFAHAADRMGADAAAPPLPLTGPAEIAGAAASFNAMQARIHRLLQERGEMVGAIAHDLRTPLARLAFRLDALPAPGRDKASADIEEMSQMIDATLEFIRDQNRERVREPLDLRLLVESVVDNLRDTGHDATLAPGPAAPMQGDPMTLRRMTANLVDNAIKYGQRARASLQPEGDGYRLQVDDDGPGIDPDQVEPLFMPFVRGEGSRNRATGGIGLGLASVRAAVQAHGGHIELQNRDGGGLRACVHLPARLY